MKVPGWVRRLTGRPDPSHEVDPRVVAAHLADPSFAALVSFPRTGSHWLRMLMERSFGKPALVRTFFEHDADSFTCIHMHDVDLDVRRRSVIYLFRDPVATIRSHLRYHALDPTDPILVRYWSTRYALHLRKWLHDEHFTVHKTVVRYRDIGADPVGVLTRIGEHLDLAVTPERVRSAAREVTRDLVAQKTPHDPKVVDRSPATAMTPAEFGDLHGALIRESLARQDIDPDDPTRLLK